MGLQTWIKRGNLGRPSSKGTASVGALLLGATANVAVTLDPPMPTATYVAVASLKASTTLLANVTVKGIVSQTTTTVTVMVQANGVLSAGAEINVIVKS